MSSLQGRVMIRSCLALCALFALTGCAFVTDLINPNFLTSLGIDPQVVIRSQGKIIIAFKNSTAATVAFMSAITSDDSQIDADNILTNEDLDIWDVYNLAANETRTVVVDCPVYLVQPLTAVAIGTEGVTELTYEGFVLFEGDAYRCGDVIEMEVYQGVGGPAIRVRVIPGR